MTNLNTCNISKIYVPFTLLTLTFAILFSSKTVASCFGLGGSEGLNNYCVLNAINGKTINHQTATAIDARLRRAGSGLGLNLPNAEPVEKITTSYSIRPVLRYSNNINGGNSAKPLVLGKAVFRTDEALYRISGTVAGLALGLNGRTIYGEGKYLTFGLNTEYALSTSTDDKIISTSATICSFNHLGQLWYLSGCANKYVSRKTITDNSGSDVKLMMSHILTGASKKHHELKVGVKRLFTKSYTQDQLILGVETLHLNNVFTSLEVTVGKPVPDELVTHIAVTGRATFKVAGKPLSLTASTFKGAGGLVLGSVLNSKGASISASYPVWRNLTATIGYSKNDSTIDYFDSATPTIGIQFSGIQF